MVAIGVSLCDKRQILSFSSFCVDFFFVCKRVWACMQAYLYVRVYENVCMCTHVYNCYTYQYVYMRVCMCRFYFFECLRAFVYVCICMCRRVHACLYFFIQRSMYACINVGMCRCNCFCVTLLLCVFACMYQRKYVTLFLFIIQ